MCRQLRNANTESSSKYQQAEQSRAAAVAETDHVRRDLQSKVMQAEQRSATAEARVARLQQEQHQLQQQVQDAKAEAQAAAANNQQQVQQLQQRLQTAEALAQSTAAGGQSAATPGEALMLFVVIQLGRQFHGFVCCTVQHMLHNNDSVTFLWLTAQNDS